MVYFICIAWLVLTVATALWWLYLGLKLSSAQVHDYQNMFIIEGIVFVALIVGGGIGLIFALRQSQKKSQSLAEFLSTISHEIKTSITNIRLQAGLLSENKNIELEKRSLSRLKDQCMRLETQLENSLLLADQNQSKPYMQRVLLPEFLEHQKENWSALNIEAFQLNEVYADTRALECIFNNAFQNALKHQQEKNIFVRQWDRDKYHVVEIETRGKKYDGPSDTLGNPFFHFGTTGGSGLGLYLTQKMMQQMGGRAEFLPTNDKFVTQLFFKKYEVGVPL